MDTSLQQSTVFASINSTLPSINSPTPSNTHSNSSTHSSNNNNPAKSNNTNPISTQSSNKTLGDVSDSEWEEAVVLRDGRRYPIAEKEKHVTLLALFSIIYFCVCSGPYGVEESVRAGGPGYTLIFLIIVPLIQHLPIGLLTCELASAMPQNGGYIIWISRSFGNFWSFQEGWWCWLSALVDSSLYVLILNAYTHGALISIFPQLIRIPHYVLYITRVTFVLLITVTNLLGIQIVGVMSVLFAILTLVPFFIMGLMGIDTVVDVLAVSKSRGEMLELFSITDVHWGILLSALLWVGSGWDSPGTVAGDVKSPKRTYPYAVYCAVIAVIITNMLPVISAIAAYVTYDDLTIKSWDISTNFWADMAYRIGGRTLWCSVTLSAIITSIGLLSLLITSSAWALYALSLPGLLDCHSLTQLHSYFRTPIRCIAINTILLFICVVASFSDLLQIAMTLHMTSLTLEACSLIWLRIIEPTMKRPYKIPLTSPYLIIMFLPQFCITIILYLTIDTVPFIIVICTVLIGFTAYFLARLINRLSLAPGIEPETVDLELVFEDLNEANIDNDISDSNDNYTDHIPELGQRYSVQVEQLPESIIGSDVEYQYRHNSDYNAYSDDTDTAESTNTSPIQTKHVLFNQRQNYTNNHNNDANDFEHELDNLESANNNSKSL